MTNDDMEIVLGCIGDATVEQILKIQEVCAERGEALLSLLGVRKRKPRRSRKEAVLDAPPRIVTADEP